MVGQYPYSADPARSGVSLVSREQPHRGVDGDPHIVGEEGPGRHDDA